MNPEPEPRPPLGVCIVCGSDMLVKLWRIHPDNKKVHCNNCASEIALAWHKANQPGVQDDAKKEPTK